jgi:hypothetical protein
MARKKDLIAQNPDYVINVIDVLTENDTSGTNKYVPFMIKQTKDWVEWLHKELANETFKQMFDIIKDFEDLSQRNLLDNKDIYSYESNADIMEAVKLAKEKVTRSEVKKKETVVLHEDEKWLVIFPLTSRSSNMYGKATKWCVASDDQSFKRYFKQYTEQGVLVYLIDKTIKDKDARNSENKLSKVAFHMDRSKRDGLTVWDAQDNQLSVMDMMRVSTSVGGDIMNIINEKLEKGETNQEVANTKNLKD